MDIYLVRTLIGVFALDKTKKLVLFKPYSGSSSDVAEKILSKLPSEYDEVKNELKRKGVKNFIEGDRNFENSVRRDLVKYAIEYKIVKNSTEFNFLLSKINIEISKQRIRLSASRDSLIIHANNAIEEIEKSMNIFIERLREFYSMHFPEMDRIVSNHEKYAEIIEKYGSKEKIEESELKQASEKSMGMDFSDDDVKIVKLFAHNILELYNLRKELSDYLRSQLKQTVPNFYALAGDTVAAKLISRAGGLERLSKMPSSTIQLLGSEKSLFRFLKSQGKSKSPKFGLIYNHPLIQNAPKSKQGKIARLLAAKLAIAARIDFYSKEYKADKMKKELEDKVKEVSKSQND